MDAQTASYEVTSQALTIVTTTVSLLDPEAIPFVIFAGSLSALLAIFSQDNEPPVYVTTDDLQLVTDLIIDNIKQESWKQDARNAAALIASTYDWYVKYNQQYSSVKNISKQNIETISQQVNDALGPNSNLYQGINLLKQNRDVGKYEVRHYVLGAGLHMKLLFLEAALKAYCDERIDWSYIAGVATLYFNKLGELMGAANMEMGINLEQWKTLNPGYTQEDWFKERDRNVYLLYGGASSYEDLIMAKREFFKMARGAENRSQGQDNTTVLRYGEFYKYHIQNQYNQGRGGFLDTNGRRGDYLNVTTSQTPDRGANDGHMGHHAAPWK